MQIIMIILFVCVLFSILSLFWSIYLGIFVAGFLIAILTYLFDEGERLW